MKPRDDEDFIEEIEETAISQAIQRRAFELYCERGKEPGHEEEDWFAAEREIRDINPHRARMSPVEAAPPSPLRSSAPSA